MTPHHRPTHVGDICWDQAYVNEMLSPIAQMDQSEIDWFLATHSPITCTDDVGPVKQQVLLDDLLSAFKRETLVVLKGDPGTGKSQLINWLKLGFDVRIASGARLGIGDKTLRSVLIRRRSGSLKDALQQLVDQLPGYERYLDQIAAAIEGISGEAANRRLYTEMHHALLGARASAPRLLKELDQVFIDNGAASWLCRPQGAIDLNIKRLTEQSDATARESLPLFTSEDFNFPAKVGFGEDLKLRLADDEGFRERAVARANDHLRQAIAGLTGLRGHTLNEIFRAIREEMQRRGEALALFVEDVSTLSVLDEELVNALQPQNDRSLCPLLSVLGMTEPAYARLPDNLKGRINRVLTLSAESSLLIPDGTDGADAFVARYLNALRSGPTQVGLLADDARRHGEVQHSACADCSLKSNCFATFGSVQMGGSEVGLYPLSPGAAVRLLDGLNTDTTLRTPRTLLQYIVQPLLSGMATEFRGATVGLPLHPRAPLDLNTQQERLLASWTAEQRGRVSYLLYYWTGAEALAAGASALSPMLRWFRHPAFSSAPPVRSPAPSLPRPPLEVPVPERAPETDTRYQDAVARLETWFQQQRPLVRDKEYRDLLAAVVNKSLVLDDVRMPSDRIRRLSSQITAGNIVIEDMISRPAAASKARFEFARSQDVFDLLRDLLSFEYLGRFSWRFEGGQAACRRYGRWLEVHRDELIRAFNVVKCDRDAALRAGIRFLRLAYRFSTRKDLPSDRAAAVEAITSFRPGTIGTLSDAARALAADLPQRLQAIRGVVFDELAVRQGGGGLNFIDPRPLVEHLSVAPDNLSLGELDMAATMADYPDIGRLAQSRWGQLPAVLQDEAAALRKRVESLDTTVRQWGVVADSVPQMLREYLEGARAVVKACEAANETLGDRALQTEIGHLAPAVVSRHVTTIEQVVSVLDQEWLGILTLDVGDTQKTFDLVARSDRAIGLLRDALAQRLSDVVTGEDVEAERQECLGAIQELITSEADGTEISGATSS